MKTYTFTFTSSQGRVKREVWKKFANVTQVISFLRGAMTAMTFYMVEGEKLTCTIHYNGELIWEESCTK